MVTNESVHSDDVFSLDGLLGGGITLVIPDMQRDYCWGTDAVTVDSAGGKVPIFAKALVYLCHSGQDTPLGLLYGYEDPPGSGRILIIDGQQRITTLYLLLGMLYRRTPTDELRRLLISDGSVADDPHPRLLYQSRSEAMYFMADLVNNFFLDRNGRLSQLENSPWYFAAYASDPTIQGFIRAIRQLDDVLEEAARMEGWDFAAFADFVMHKMRFIYHDMGSRRLGEEMFITINTTGQPLTYAQNVKSLLMAVADGEPDLVEYWEEMEQWAWLSRDKEDASHPGTSDQAMERVIRLWIAVNGGDESCVLHSDCLESLFNFFNGYRRLVECVPAAHRVDIGKPEAMFCLLPTIIYILRWRFDDSTGRSIDRYIRDMWHWLSYFTAYTRVTSSGTDMAAALKLVRLMPHPDITSILDVRGVSDRIVNSETRAILSLLADSGRQRGAAAKILRRAQAHNMLCGKVHKVISWCRRRDGATDLAMLDRYVSSVYDIWGADIDANPALDDLRRALLTLRHPDYPIMRRGNTCLSFGWYYYDWQRLMTNAPGLVRLLIDRVSQYQMPVTDALRRMADKFADRNHPYYFLISNPAIMSRCQHRMMLRPCEAFMGFYLVEDSGTSWSTDMRWYVEQVAVNIDRSQWSTIRAYGARCLYTDHRVFNLTIDLYYTPDDKSKYRLEMFERDGSDRPACQYLKIDELFRQLGYNPMYDKRRRRQYILLSDARSATRALARLAAQI